LRHNSSPPRQFCACTGTSPQARNARVSATRICLTVSAANAASARRRERLSNWLALLALLALAFV
jgi:hypothetical protein